MKPSLQDPRQRLTQLRNELLKLHAVLLESERAQYDRDIQRIRSSQHFLELALNDPAFAWLRVLSQLVVLIDETLDAIIALDDQYQAGNLSEAAYRERRAELKATLKGKM